ncbi:hypothetical protein FO519_009485 [Halicephalobus sp. NKZ332]|nr:hypothetical protein FO519_009485 [Halicephalobus sp. NKZ332]
MRVFAVLFLSFGISVSGLNIFDNVFQLTDPAIMNLISMAGPSNSAVSDYFCDLPHLNAMQIGFNNYVGLDPSYTWKNASTMYFALDMLIANSTNNYLKVCQGRKMFYNSMGSTYTDCTNPLFLAGHLPAGGNLSEPYAYGAMWQQLDFICNGGLPIGLYSYAALMNVYGTPQGMSCSSTFLTNINNNPTDMCNIVGTYMVCLQEAYVNSVSNNKPNGWWICERIRVGYAPYCLGLRCNVLTT